MQGASSYRRKVQFSYADHKTTRIQLVIYPSPGRYHLYVSYACRKWLCLARLTISRP